MNDDRRTVTVSNDSIEAYGEPQFVLEHQGKIYVTLAVVEFDPNDQDMDDDERSDLSELQAMLEGERDVSGTVVSEPQAAMALANSETRNDR